MSDYDWNDDDEFWNGDDDNPDDDTSWLTPDELIDIRGTSNPFILELMDDLGISHIDGFKVDISEVPEDFKRGNVFGTLEEALAFLFELGVLGFSGVYYDDGWRTSIPPCSNPPC